MMNKTDALFVKITGGTMVLLLGIIGYFSRQTYEEFRESRKEQQQTQVEVVKNKADTDGYCKVFDMKLNNFENRITLVEQQLNIKQNGRN